MSDNPSKLTCPHCGGPCVHKEIHADTGYDEFVAYCPKCRRRSSTTDAREAHRRAVRAAFEQSDAD